MKVTAVTSLGFIFPPPNGCLKFSPLYISYWYHHFNEGELLEEEEEKATKFHTPRDMQGTSSLADLSGGG